MEDRQELIANAPFELSEADLEVLGQTDEEFVPHTWEELKGVIATKDTSNLRRTPTGLANYMRWIRQTRERWDSLATYILQERLHWVSPAAPPAATHDSTSSTIPQTETTLVVTPRSNVIFADPEDYCIRRNDWPYGCEAGIVHLLVWLKPRIPVEGALGDPTPDAEQRINAFVDETFQQRIHAEMKAEGSMAAVDAAETAKAGPMEVMWFRNRTRWQSVRALEHVHVLCRNVPEALIYEWTGQTAGDTIAEHWARGNRM